MSKEELIKLSGDCVDLGKAVEYAFSVQEYKLAEGALSGVLDRNVALKMLETYNGWKGDVNILQKNEYKQYMNEAKVKAEAILRREATGSLVDELEGDLAEDLSDDEGFNG
jgi:hypothetical protein